MTETAIPENTFPELASLAWMPYLDEHGAIPEQVQGVVGAYAIFDPAQELRYVGYSRDIALSLQQHLVRQPQACDQFKFVAIARPSRTVLEQIRDAWIAENGAVPVGNGPEAAAWNDPIDVRAQMTAEEQASYDQALSEGEQGKILKAIARRVESQILAQLQARGMQMSLRFNPKLKEAGILDLK